MIDRIRDWPARSTAIMLHSRPRLMFGCGCSPACSTPTVEQSGIYTDAIDRSASQEIDTTNVSVS
jgi:hypothetical protein